MSGARARSPRRLDVLGVGTLPPHRGGSALGNAELLVGLRDLGHRVRAIAPVKPRHLALDPGVLHRDLDGIPVDRFEIDYPSPSTPPSETYLREERVLLGSAFERAVRERHPDVVLLGRESFAWHAPGLCRRHGVALVMVACGTPTSGLLTGLYPDSRRDEILARFQEMDLVIAVGRHLAEILDTCGVPGALTIPNAVDVERFHPGAPDPALARALSIEPDDVVALHVSQLNRRKRPLDIVNAAAAALVREPRLRFAIVGDGPMRQEMVKTCRALGIEDRFHFAGHVPHADVPRWLSVADLVIVPSAQEGLARVYLEAQACAKVLVASDIGPAHEVVRDGDTGLLFKMADPEDLASRLLLAAGDEELRRALGERARREALRHDLPGWLRSYERALLEVVAARRR